MSLTSYEEKRLQEIRNFEECLQDGFELYTTGKSAIEYYFGSRTLKEVFETAFSCEELRKECVDLADRMYFIIERDLSKHIKRQLEVGLMRDEAKLFVRRIFVFWQLYELSAIDGVLTEEVKIRMRNFLTKIDQSLANFKYKAELNILPSDFVTALENMTLEDRHSPVPSNSRLSQIDSAIYRMEVKGGEEEERSKEIRGRVEKIMDELLAGRVPSTELVQLRETNVVLMERDTEDVMERLFSTWWPLVEGTDMRVAEGALKTLHFILMSAKERDGVVERFHRMYREKKSALPTFTTSPLLPTGKKAITGLINEMGSHDEMQKDASRQERVLEQFHWLALVAPEDTISSLLQRCYIDKRIVAPSVKLFSSLASLSSLSSTSSSHPLIVSSLLSIARSSDYSLSEEREALVYLIASMTRQKKNGKDHPVISAGRAYKLFVSDSIASGNEDKLTVALSLLVRLFSTGETKHSRMEFTTRIGEKKEGAVESPELLLFLVNQMGSAEQEKRGAMFEMTKKTIKQFGSKLREDGIVWDTETATFVLSRLSACQWFVKVAITQWFSSVLGEPKRQIPSGLLSCLSSTLTPQFDQILVPFDFSPVECFLRSLYEVAVWDLPFALHFLSLGITIPPLDDSMADKLSLALVDVTASVRSADWQSLLPLYPLTQRLVNVLDVTIDCRLERINAAIYHSINNQRALNVLARATKLAFITNAEEQGRENHWALLQLFCSSAKQYIDGEMEGWRKFEKMKAKDRFNGVASLPSDSEMEKISSSEFVMTQCATLFPLTVTLTHIAPKAPPCLQVLLSTISSYLSEFHARPPPASLDALPPMTGVVPDTTVYAYAKGAKETTERKVCSATNQMFDISDRDRSIGTARAISDQSMATMIENKLRSGEERREGGGGGGGGQSQNGSTSANKRRNNKNGRRK